jgi:prophage regulatory protein
MSEAPVPGDCLLSLAQVIAKTSLSRSSIYRKMNAGLFPLAVQVSEFRVAWWLSEVEEWTRNRPRKIIASAA